MKKKFSLLLAVMLLLTSLPLNTVLASSNLSTNITIGTDSLKGMVLVDTDIVTIQDDEGNDINVIVEEYGEVTKKSKNKNSDISPMGLYPEYEVGTKRTWVFTITNEELGATGILNAPLSASAKKKLTDAIVKLIGNKIGSAIVPALGWTVWVATSAGIVNAALGKTGFKASISGVYTKQYYNSGGYYVYAWSLNKPSVSSY